VILFSDDTNRISRTSKVITHNIVDETNVCEKNIDIWITGWRSKFYTEVGSFSMEPGVGYPTLGSLSAIPEVGGDKG